MKEPVVLEPLEDTSEARSLSAEVDSPPATALSRTTVVDSWTCLETKDLHLLENNEVKTSLAGCLVGCVVGTLTEEVYRQADVLAKLLPQHLRLMTQHLPTSETDSLPETDRYSIGR